MRIKSAYFIFTVIIVLAALFVMRQRTLNNLREDNGSLRKQIDLEKSARAARFVELPANTVAKLSTADERELLQLRSKIVPLAGAIE